MNVNTVTLRSSSGDFRMPALIIVEGESKRTLLMNHSPFGVGRRPEKDLSLADPRVSRDHALLVSHDGEYFVEDLGSRHGTYVNGEKVEKRKLQRDDKIEFGARDAAYVIFDPQRVQTSSTGMFMSQIASIRISSDSTDLAKLTLFLDAARKLNSAGLLDEILFTLIEATLRLTGAERGFVFLKNKDGSLAMAAGLNAKGEPIASDGLISHSIVQEAMQSNSEFMLTDTSQEMGVAARQSIVANDLRTVICMPLRGQGTGKGAPPEVLGALYVDARYTARDFSKVGREILHTIATEAASLLEKARLVEAEEASRRYQQELAIAATIQQGLLTVTMPDVAFAKLRARSIACKQVGGDFYDAVAAGDSIGFVLADVSGKGVSAALLASTLQGMFYSHLKTGAPLCETLAGINSYLCAKSLSAKYATAVVGQLQANGELEFVNCGHVAPLLWMKGVLVRPQEGCMPVGLLPSAEYSSVRVKLSPGDRMIVVTDGVTEAEDMTGEFFDNPRLEEVVAGGGSLDEILRAVDAFRGDLALTDDCTVVEIEYTGQG